MTQAPSPFDLNHFSPRDGDVLVFPLGTEHEEMMRFGQALKALHGDKRFMLVCGDISMIPEAEMNAAGWYRK